MLMPEPSACAGWPPAALPARAAPPEADQGCSPADGAGSGTGVDLAAQHHPSGASAQGCCTEPQVSVRALRAAIAAGQASAAMCARVCHGLLARTQGLLPCLLPACRACQPAGESGGCAEASGPAQVRSGPRRLRTSGGLHRPGGLQPGRSRQAAELPGRADGQPSASPFSQSAQLDFRDSKAGSGSSVAPSVPGRPGSAGSESLTHKHVQHCPGAQQGGVPRRCTGYTRWAVAAVRIPGATLARIARAHAGAGAGAGERADAPAAQVSMASRPGSSVSQQSADSRDGSLAAPSIERSAEAGHISPGGARQPACS